MDEEEFSSDEILNVQDKFLGTIWRNKEIDKVFKCGASYIGNNCFLSAAHCIHKIKNKNLTIQAGSSDLYNPKNIFTVKKVYIHPKFDPKKLDNDIAILHVNGDLEKFGYEPLNIPDIKLRKECYKIGNPMCVIGYGNDDPEKDTKVLRYVKGIIVKVLPFRGVYIRQNVLTKNMFQANNYNNGVVTDACHGDSGGPAIRKINNKLYQIGIVSWGHVCHKHRYPGVYTRIINYYNWINKILNSSS